MTALWSTSAPSDSEQQRATIGCRRYAFQYGENCTRLVSASAWLKASVTAG